MSERISLTEHEATVIIDGFQSGGVDEIDLISMIEDVDDWIHQSDSNAAATIREMRKK